MHVSLYVCISFSHILWVCIMSLNDNWNYSIWSFQPLLEVANYFNRMFYLYDCFKWIHNSVYNNYVVEHLSSIWPIFQVRRIFICFKDWLFLNESQWLCVFLGTLNASLIFVYFSHCCWNNCILQKFFYHNHCEYVTLWVLSCVLMTNWCSFNVPLTNWRDLCESCCNNIGFNVDGWMQFCILL